MNTLFIYSKDLDAGTIYDGQFDLNTKISGEWELKYATFTGPDTWPWIWTGTNSLEFQVFSSDDIVKITTITAYFPESMFRETNKIVIAEKIYDAMSDALIASDAFYNPSTTPPQLAVSYNSETDNMEIRSNYNPTEGGGALTIINLHYDASTCRDIFNKTSNESSGILPWIDQDPHIFLISAVNMAITDTPKFLELKVEQSKEFSVRSKSGSFPNLIISTEDIPLTNQTIHLLEPTNTLNLSFYSPLTNVGAIQFEGEYILYFGLNQPN